jgi:DNA-binding transcriptional regulator LsrR (DeoR family)
MNTDAEARELVTREAQRRLRHGQPTRREELAAKFGVTERVVQDAIAVAKDRNEIAARVTRTVTDAADWRQFENQVVRMCQEAPVPGIVIDNLLRRLADLRRAQQ